jgi:hypothetical protein
VPVEDTQRGFAAEAQRDGIDLVGQSVDWLNQRGHLGLPDDETRRNTVAALERIYLALGGDLSALATAKTRRLRGDFIHAATGTLIEVDESQHFTSFRLQTLQMYPPDVALGFDIEEYKNLCRVWQTKSDAYRRTKEARGFGVGGRQRQRAYYDALRDLATPAMGRPPLIRINAADRDPAEAYRRHRHSLIATLGG